MRSPCAPHTYSLSQKTSFSVVSIGLNLSICYNHVMNNGNEWKSLHDNYRQKGYIHKQSIFAEIALTYFPKTGTVLELGSGQGQDSRYFAQNGYNVKCTDLEQSALDEAKTNLPRNLTDKVDFQVLDLRNELPFDDESFDIVYAHLSLHYFSKDLTVRLVSEIERVLKPGGVVAILVNSVNDPQYGTGQKLENDYFCIGTMNKRFYSVETMREQMQWFNTFICDDHGETYKDNEKGVYNLIRFVGAKKMARTFDRVFPCVGAIIERDNGGVTELLLQTRWKPNSDPVYSGMFEFPAGKLDLPFECVFDGLAREIYEETGLKLKTIKNDDRTNVISSNKDDKIIGFRPFCCIQQLRNGAPWIGFIFVCEVHSGELITQISEAKDTRWVPKNEVEQMYRKSPERLFGFELPAWEYYFNNT